MKNIKEFFHFENDVDFEVLKHHLDDIKESLMLCYEALSSKNQKEILDNLAILQSSALDAEEIITGKKPKI